jgi:3-deoxy-D-manno-octulosonic-acid transferase
MSNCETETSGFNRRAAFGIRQARMALVIYRLLFPIAFLLALPFYALRLLRRERGRSTQEKPPGYQLGLGQRFGQYDAALRAHLADGPAPWWLISISVGETLVALKLARELRARDANARIVLSVTTSTGYELLLREAAKAPWLIPLYNPLDFRFTAKAALKLIFPRSVVLIEGGIWPNLLSIAKREHFSVILANARLSPRSERRWRRWSAIAEPIWRLFDLVCVSEQSDVARFASIGVEEQRLVRTGNIKFDNAASGAASREAEFRALTDQLGFTGPIIVAGSTWAPEEKALAAAYQKLRAEWPDLRLIVVPRHVERAGEIETALAPLKVARRSHLTGEPADVLLVDTTGELRDWYRIATVVFVGKSLPGIAEIGGQNAGEPAALGLPVVFGPHMENFAALVKHLLAKDAAVQIDDVPAIVPALRTLLSSPTLRTEIGRRAAEVLLPHEGATARTAAALLQLPEWRGGTQEKSGEDDRNHNSDDDSDASADDSD